MNTKKTLDYLLFGQNKGLSSLIDRVKKIAELDKVVRAELSKPLADYCRVANIRHSKLIIQTDSPVWASKLRFESTTLLAALRKQPRFAGLAGIDFFVEPLMPVYHSVREKFNKTEPQKPTLSPVNRQILLDTADKVTDIKLKEVLLAIAARK